VAQSFGIDTQTSHLDLIQWPAFQAWNGGLVPAFAGRNFIGGNFLWAPAEATLALTNPSPNDFSKLAMLTPLVAPFQGASTTRQQVTGERGTLYGQIDAGLGDLVTHGPERLGPAGFARAVGEEDEGGPGGSCHALGGSYGCPGRK